MRRRSHKLLHAILLLAFPTSVIAVAACNAAPPREGVTQAAPRAQPRLSSGKVMTDPYAVFSVPQFGRPGYLQPILDPTFGSILERIANDVGASTAPAPGTWGIDSRHTYSVQQPWNADNTLLVMENRGGGTSTSPIILDGTSYRPEYAPCSNYHPYDYRWHPSLAHAHEQIDVNEAGTELMWFDVSTCTKTRSWTLPMTVDYGIGSGKGNPTSDGRFLALGNNSAMFVVDMDPQPPYAPYPNVRIGPIYTFPPESLTVAAPDTFTIDHLSISPSGRYVDVKFGSADDCGTFDMHRIYDVDPATLALKVHNMADASDRCCFQGRPNGWIFPLKHADLASDPFDNNEDVLVGGRSCLDSDLGPVVKVRLRDGAVTPLTFGDNQSAVFHVSTRNTDRPGWAYVSWYKVDGKRFSDEIVAVKMDGSQTVERLCHMHSASAGCYRCESHPVPSRDGTRVLFASNWAQDCGAGCGDTTDIKEYVVTHGVALGVNDPPAAATALALNEIRPNPTGRAPFVDYSLESWAPAQIELVDIVGRTVLRQDLGSPGPGHHGLNLSMAPGLRTGLYLVRLMQSGRSVSSKVVLRQ
jgi:hypothetical protein